MSKAFFKNVLSKAFRSTKSQRKRKKIYETPMDSTRDLLVRYIIRELIDERAHMRQQKQKERDEKHTIAIIGAATAVVTTIITAITTYFASK